MSLARPATAGLLVLLTLLALPSGAQQVYRIVGPDGRVTFSDRPPPETQGKATPAPSVTLPGGQSAAAGSIALPFELRTAVGKYPVTLYSRHGCAPCEQGRAYLTSRGVPFTEKTVHSPEDVEAFQRLANPPLSLPLLTIGAQQLKGYSSAEWGQYLDAAGYPKTSQLPVGYRQPAPSPLVAAIPAQAPQSPAGQAGAETPAAPVFPPPANPENPAGIRF